LHNVKMLNAIGLVVEIFVVMTPRRFEIARHFHRTIVARGTNASVFVQAPLEARAPVARIGAKPQLLAQ
jgi:hypothetical protein